MSAFDFPGYTSFMSESTKTETLVLSRRMLEENRLSVDFVDEKCLEKHAISLCRFLCRMHHVKVIVVEMSKSPVSGPVLPLDRILGEAIRRVPRDQCLSLQQIIVQGGPVGKAMPAGQPHSLVMAMAEGKTPFLRRFDSGPITPRSAFELGEGQNPRKLAEAYQHGHLRFLTHLQLTPDSLPLFLKAFQKRHTHNHANRQALMEELQVVRRDVSQEKMLRVLAPLLVLPYFKSLRSLIFSVKVEDAETQLATLSAYIHGTNGAPELQRITICLPESYQFLCGTRFSHLFLNQMDRPRQPHPPDDQVHAGPRLGGAGHCLYGAWTVQAAGPDFRRRSSGGSAGEGVGEGGGRLAPSGGGSP